MAGSARVALGASVAALTTAGAPEPGGSPTAGAVTAWGGLDEDEAGRFLGSHS